MKDNNQREANPSPFAGRREGRTMKAKTVKIKKIVSEMIGVTRNINESVCVWDNKNNRGCIIPPASEDYFYSSLLALKKEIRGRMQYGGHKPVNCSWACGNEQELEALAEMAGLSDWVKEQEKKLGIK